MCGRTYKPRMTVLCLCASHINNMTRLAYFGCMLKSWHDQIDARKDPVKCKMIVLLSAADKRLYDGAVKIAEKYLEDDQLRIWEVEGRQFEKYKVASERLLKELNANDWLIFTDDDDLWHKQRVEFFNFFTSDDHSHDVVRVMRICENLKTVTEQNYTIAEHIDKALAEDKLDIVDETQTNYVNYMVRFHVLHNFFTAVSPILLKHKYADMGFCQYLNTKFELPEVSMYNETNWMYYFRMNKDLGQTCMQPRRSIIVKRMNYEVHALAHLVERAAPDMKDCFENVNDLLNFMFDRLELFILTNGYHKTQKETVLREALARYFHVEDNDPNKDEVKKLRENMETLVWPFVADALKKHDAYLRKLSVD